jgi:hypothetical protein
MCQDHPIGERFTPLVVRGEIACKPVWPSFIISDDFHSRRRTQTSQATQFPDLHRIIGSTFALDKITCIISFQLPSFLCHKYCILTSMPASSHASAHMAPRLGASHFPHVFHVPTWEAAWVRAFQLILPIWIYMTIVRSDVKSWTEALNILVTKAFSPSKYTGHMIRPNITAG